MLENHDIILLFCDLQHSTLQLTSFDLKITGFTLYYFFQIVLRNILDLDPDSRSSGSGLRFLAGSGFN